MKNKLRTILRHDLTMWIGIVAVIFASAGIVFLVNAEERQITEKRVNISKQINEDKAKILKENPEFVLPNAFVDDYITEAKNPKIADKIEIKDYYLNPKYTQAAYTLKNNYDHDIIITPEVVKFINHRKSSTSVLLNDFNQAYRILKPGEEVHLTAIIDRSIREYINRKEFCLHRLIYKNDEKQTVVGYIKIGDGNE